MKPISLRRRWPSWAALCAATALLTSAVLAQPATGPAAQSATATVASPARAERICLVLSGGGARGAAHVGVIKVLEELRVPIHCIAGTSMGAIVGAAYASGMSVAEMEAALREITAERLFVDNPPRATTSTPRKRDDYLPLAAPEFGVTADGLTSPKGLVSGVALEAELRRLVKVRSISHFDKLPIPFRAVATSLGDGKMVVFDRGELPTAMRASMAVPALVAPLNIDGRLLVDGGLVRNLPVDVAREMGATVVIAVNLGTPLLKPEQIVGILGVSQQMINILTEENVNRSLASLKPTDILVLPELGDFSAGNFDNLPQAVPVGEAAARQVADALSRHSLPPAEFAALRKRQTVAADPADGVIEAIVVTGNQRVSETVVIESMVTRVGDPVDRAAIDLDMRRIYGRGDFETVRPELKDVDGKQTLVVNVTEKSWGPTYARFGLSLQGALGQSTSFNLYASTRTTWLNRRGAEWRNDLSLGEVVDVATSLYQPLSEHQVFFVEPKLQLFSRPFDFYIDNILFASYREQGAATQVDLGANLGQHGEARLGVQLGHREFELDTGPALLPVGRRVSTSIGSVVASLRLDRLDNAALPRSGYLLTLDALHSNRSLGADDDYSRFEARLRAATSFGAHTVRLAMRAGDTPDGGELPAYAQFQLGGFLEMSGYRAQQLIGPRYAYGRLLYQGQQVLLPLLGGVYTGAAVEAARMPQLVQLTTERNFMSGTLYLAAETPLGVAYLGYGYADDNNQALYLMLGSRY
jgi:NTE family protein